MYNENTLTLEEVKNKLTGCYLNLNSQVHKLTSNGSLLTAEDALYELEKRYKILKEIGAVL